MAVAGTIFALSNSLPLLILAGLTGTLSVDVSESGPFTSVEQAMIPEVAGEGTTRAFGRYNAVAALAGAGGALVAGVHPSVPTKTVPEFIAYAKGNPGEPPYATA